MSGKDTKAIDLLCEVRGYVLSLWSSDDDRSLPDGLTTNWREKPNFSDGILYNDAALQQAPARQLVVCSLQRVASPVFQEYSHESTEDFALDRQQDWH